MPFGKMKIDARQHRGILQRIRIACSPRYLQCLAVQLNGIEMSSKFVDMAAPVLALTDDRNP
ncbi:hypothetical protein [Bifidobacterium sp. UTBIF-78]|uniref:hypothetical protein n=1 Tax=Bifidobacterium sp. UTBIF-78 TaxID=1465263 RepID=UPI0011269538|nr:hypothetical protein [Bifidobacterium sp. UTBIF-78]